MTGAWILPSGNMFFTSDIFNHEYQIKRYNLDKFFLKHIVFNDNEKINHLDKDVRYIAFKSGLIRLVTFKNQFAIEAILNTITNDAIKSIIFYINNYIDIEKIQDFVVEDPSNNQTLFFTSFLEFKQQFLDKKYNNLR